MVSKALLKQTRQLHQKKFRNERHSFLVEGEKLVFELLQSDFIVEHLFATKEWHQPDITSSESFHLHEVTDNELAEISMLESPNQVLAVVKMKEVNAMEVAPGMKYLALDGIRDPGNLGTILRIADWFGIHGIFCSPGTVEMYNPKVVQASMGSIFRIPLIVTDLAPLILKANKVTGTYAAMLNGTSVYTTDIDKGWLLVVGNESTGIDTGLIPAIQHHITIPSYGSGEKAESLNAAVATAIICAEFCRR
jgi:RNA methyltransferase, TrmH family